MARYQLLPPYPVLSLSTAEAVDALEAFVLDDATPSAAHVVLPAPLLVNADLTPSSTWGRIRRDLKVDLGLPSHLHADLIGAPEGGIVRGVCDCGARRELLADHRVSGGAPAGGHLPADALSPAERDAAAALRDGWAGEHLACHQTPRQTPITDGLVAAAATPFSHLHRAVEAGRRVVNCMGLVYESGGAVVAAVAPVEDLPSGRMGRELFTTGWAARQFALREALRLGGHRPLGGFVLLLRRRSTPAGRQPRSVARRSVSAEQSALWLAATSATAGHLTRTRWRACGRLLDDVRDLEMLRIASPLDAVDGLMAEGAGA